MNTEKKEIDIIDLLTALHAGRWLIIGGTLAICVLAGGLSFLLPKEYEATVQILPPREKKESFGFSSMLASLPIPALRLGERGTPSDISLATIKSTTTRRQMIEKFGLMQRYEARTLTDALEVLADNTTAAMTEEGMLGVSVLDKDPQMAADMANYYIVLLDSTNKRFAHKTASDRLDFIRGILQEEDKRLDDKMKLLEEFQSEHNAISIDDQARAAILTATSMRTAAMELAIEHQRLILSGLGPNHDKVKQLEREILLRQGTIAFLRDGLNPADNTMLQNKALQLQLGDENLFLPLNQIPGVAQEYANLEKDVLVQTSLMLVLLQQEAQALIEAKDATSTVQILDPATPPEIKAKPQRELIVFLAGLLSLIASVSYVLGAVYMRGLQQRWRERRETTPEVL
ncbi:MAG: Wzz/FepE/Etk N-terminal domain-containing protein [Gemmatimonadetes bacterium]|nr:Wzz/FepE/Etk N-terminal domain-containing protein [Gemmatimonadota bacterium]